jgi:hypothetical protein
VQENCILKFRKAMLYRELGILPYIGALYNLASGAGDLNEIMDWG